MNIYIAITLGAILFIAVYLVKAYIIPGLAAANLITILLLILAVITILIIASY